MLFKIHHWSGGGSPLSQAPAGNAKAGELNSSLHAASNDRAKSWWLWPKGLQAILLAVSVVIGARAVGQPVISEIGPVEDVAMGGDTMAMIGFESDNVQVWRADGNGGWTADAYLPVAGGKRLGPLDVSSDGNSLAVGVHADYWSEGPGQVLVYHRNTGGVWQQEALLEALPGYYTPYEEDGYGYRLALDGDNLAVTTLFYEGRYQRPYPSEDALGGAVYLYSRSNGTWNFEQRIQPENPFGVVPEFSGDTEWFGRGLDLDGSTLAVGSPYADGPGGGTGVVYLFERGAAGWVQSGLVACPEPEGWLVDQGWLNPEGFGESLAMQGGTLLICAPFDGSTIENGGSGCVYFYELQGGAWQQVAKFVDYDDSTGMSGQMDGPIHISGDTATVFVDNGSGEFCAMVDEFGDCTEEGWYYQEICSLHVFNRDGSGGWVFAGRLHHPVIDAGNAFGKRSAIGPHGVVVGCNTDAEGNFLVEAVRRASPLVNPVLENGAGQVLTALAALFMPGGSGLFAIAQSAALTADGEEKAPGTLFIYPLESLGDSSVGAFAIAVPTVEEVVQHMFPIIEGYNIKKGMKRKLVRKLQRVLDALNGGGGKREMSPCRALDSFEEEVLEELGDKLSLAQVDELIGAAEEVAAMLGCAAYQPEHDCEEASEQDDD